MFKTCVLLAAILAASPAVAQTCPELPGAISVESERYVVAYRTRPDRIAVGRHFTMDIVVCPRTSGGSAPESLRVDAHMPEHKHGMNYRVTVTPAEGARYLAEGFLFHMPGRWELVFELRADGRTDRAMRSIVLE